MNERYIVITCPECGKVFQPEYVSLWGWRAVDNRLVCSYTCQRKSEKRAGGLHRKPQKKRIAVRIAETGEVFESLSDCAAYLGTSTSSVGKCIYQGKTYKGLHIERVDK